MWVGDVGVFVFECVVEIEEDLAHLVLDQGQRSIRYAIGAWCISSIVVKSCHKILKKARSQS